MNSLSLSADEEEVSLCHQPKEKEKTACFARAQYKTSVSSAVSSALSLSSSTHNDAVSLIRLLQFLVTPFFFFKAIIERSSKCPDALFFSSAI